MNTMSVFILTLVVVIVVAVVVVVVVVGHTDHRSNVVVVLVVVALVVLVCAAADTATPRPVGRGPRRRGADQGVDPVTALQGGQPMEGAPPTGIINILYVLLIQCSG